MTDSIAVPDTMEQKIWDAAEKFGWQGWQRLSKVPGVEFKIKAPRNGRESLRYVEVNFDKDGNVVEVTSGGSGSAWLDIVPGEGVTSSQMRDLILAELANRA